MKLYLFSLLLIFSVRLQAADSLTITPEQGHDQFNQSIDQAKQSIDMVMYHLTDRETVTHLLNALQRGVHIRLILDRGNLKNQAQVISTQLSGAGAEVKASSVAFSITHEKAAVFDDQSAIISSINLTNTGFYTRDFGVLTVDSDVIKEMDTVFSVDWQNADAGTKNTPPLQNPKLVWSPVNSKDKINEFLKSATKSIYIEVENLGDRDILQTLEDQAHAGVSVTVIVPGCVEGAGTTRNIPFLQELAQAGVQATAEAPPYSQHHPYIHAKTIVVDGERLYVGSENFSYNSLQDARELGIIESDPAMSQQIQQVIVSDLAQATSGNGLQTLRCSGVSSGQN